MTTLKGAMRSYGATIRRIEREQQRSAKLAAKIYKEQQKQKDLQNAAQAVQNWSNYIDVLQSVHKNTSEPINWDEIKSLSRPIEPNMVDWREKSAQFNLTNYRPSFWDKLFRSTPNKIRKLQMLLQDAKNADHRESEFIKKQHAQELDDWLTLQDISKGIEVRNIDSYKNALELFDPFSDIDELGNHLSFSFSKNYVDVDMHVNSEEIIPDHELKLTATGKLSQKNIPKSRFNELYQDHVCSSVLRIARETFSYLPVEYVRVNAIGMLLNSKTGHLEDKPILSVIITKTTVNLLNLDTIDPSDSMNNFVHNMNFSKANGFGGVDKVEFIKN